MTRSILLTFILVILAISTVQSTKQEAKLQKKKSSWVVKLGEDDWHRMLEGEWMVEFYAPWCPACKALLPVWENLAMDMKEIGVNVAKIDVTEAPGLSGRFMITALPTIYHVQNGVFRQYKSPRDRDSLRDFITSKTWSKIEPVSNWMNPTSIQMSIVSQFFRISQILRGVHNKLMEDYGLPTWGIYLILALGTIVVGAILGLLIVCIIDFIYPPKNYQRRTRQKDGDSDTRGEEKSDDEIVDSVKDDLVDEEGSEESEDQSEKESKSQTSSPNVRKRRARKAD